MNVPILFSLSQADHSNRNNLFHRADPRYLTGFIGHGFRNVNRFSCGDPKTLAGVLLGEFGKAGTKTISNA